MVKEKRTGETKRSSKTVIALHLDAEILQLMLTLQQSFTFRCLRVQLLPLEPFSPSFIFLR